MLAQGMRIGLIVSSKTPEGIESPVDEQSSIVQDKSVSIARGMALSNEPGLCELTLGGFIRQVAERFSDREALVACGLAKGGRVGVLMTNRAEFLSSAFGTALAGGTVAPLSTFSTLHELEYLAASTACSVFLFQRGVLKKDFAQMLCQLEPAICAAAPNHLASLRFPFLRHLAMVDSDTPMGAIETWDAFLARGGGVSLAQ